MADKTSDTFNGITEKFIDQGDGTFARKVVAASNGTFDFGAQLTTAASAHAAATVLGGLQNTIVGTVPLAGVTISNVSVRSKSGITNQVDIYFFRSVPSFSGSTGSADGDTFTLSDADKLLIPAGGRVSISPSVSGSLATQASSHAAGLALCMKTDSNSKIWWIAVATVSTTPSSTSEYQIAMNGLSDKGV